jgi:hypothetical protein
VEILQHSTGNQKSALSHFYPKVEIEHSSTQATVCLTRQPFLRIDAVGTGLVAI